MESRQFWIYCPKCDNPVYEWEKYCSLCFSPNPNYIYQKNDDIDTPRNINTSSNHPRRNKTPKEKKKEDDKCCVIMIVIFVIMCILGKLLHIC